MKKALLMMFMILSLIIAGCSNGVSGKEADKEGDTAKKEVTTNFPQKPIEIIVPFAPGGSTDVMARAIAKELPNYLPNKQQVAIINKPGAGTTLGLTEVSKADPNGYTIGFTTSSGLDIQPNYGKTAYKSDSFAPIIKVYDISTAITVLDDSPYKTFEELVEFAKENPGKLTYSAPGGAGSSGHIVMEQMSEELGIETTQVPFEGVAEIKTAIMSGQIVAGILSPDLDTGGNIRPLIFNTESKGPTDFYNDLPNTIEYGLDAKNDSYVGFVAPEGTPEEIVTILHDSILEIMELPQIKELMVNQALTYGYVGSEDFADLIEAAVTKNKEMMIHLGLIEE